MDFDNKYRNRVIYDDSDSNSDDGSMGESECLLTNTNHGAVPLVEKESDRHAMAAACNTNSSNNTTKPRQRKDSFDSIFSDSSEESIEALLRKASISKMLLSKPPTAIDLRGGMDSSSSGDSSDDNADSDSDERTKKTSLTKDKNDFNSAWCQNEGSKDFVLSADKVLGVPWPELCLPCKLYHQLFGFQRQGVQWMASLHQNGIGGILGDDMGMGKTFTTLSYLGGLMRARTIRNALIIAPLSVLRSWEKEAWKILRQCVPSIKVTVLNSEISKSRRLEIVQSLTKKKQGRTGCNLVITTYGLVRSATADFTSNSKTIWDYVALDEGHQIKNSSAAVSQACRDICSPDTRRLLLTGTPILNNLKELWSLFDFATSGKLLGSSSQFTKYYARHIEAARDRLASQSEIELGQRKNQELQSLIHPYFLQRLKIDFLKDKLPQKHDVVVWTHLSKEQRRRYTEFVQSNDSIVRSILTGTVKSPLEAVTWLKKLCGHPLLTETTGQEISSVLRHKNPDEVLEQSAKLQVLVELVMHLKHKGHRPLIFSQSTKMLDTINFVLCDKVSLARIDGTTPERERQNFVDAFNREDSRYDAMLLSTKAAGCGLTLTGADTNIIYDPSWTPAEDAQAVDRCYRIGQKQEVTVYRLIAAGTVEEKTYEKQIHKDGIRRAVLSNDQALERYFERQELRSLFLLGEEGVCRVMETLRARGAIVDLDRFEFVHDLDAVIGISRHDGFYAKGDDTNKGAFDGSAKAKPADTPKLVGKSQRVLARSETSAAETEVRARSDCKLPRHDNTPAEYTIAGASEKENQGNPKDDDIMILTSPDTENFSPPSTGDKEKIDTSDPNDAHRTSFSPDPGNTARMLDLASDHAANDRPRKALEVLLDIAESGAAQGSEKIEVHRRIAQAGAQLGLLNE